MAFSKLAVALPYHPSGYALSCVEVVSRFRRQPFPGGDCLQASPGSLTRLARLQDRRFGETKKSLKGHGAPKASCATQAS